MKRIPMSLILLLVIILPFAQAGRSTTFSTAAEAGGNFLFSPETPKEAADSLDESRIFKNKAETEKWLKEKHIPALGIGYIKDGKIQEIAVYGKNEKGKPYPKNTLFPVASLTKPVTALVAMELINEGKWDLDVPIYKYWTDPDVRYDPRAMEVTMRHLLSHQAGFPNWRKDAPEGKLAFDFPPGTKYQYSGEGYEYLRKMMEKRFKRSLPEMANEYFFLQLKMNDTHFFWDSTVIDSRVAKPHKADGSLYADYKITSVNAADGMLTSVEDYSKFLVYVMNGGGLSDDLFREMTSKQVKIKDRKYFGLGWWIDENAGNGEDAIVHGGDDEGVHTFAIMLPKSKEGLVIFTNSDTGTDSFAPVIRHYLGKPGQEIITIETK